MSRLIEMGIRALEGLFAGGMVVSLIVVCITAAEDVATVFRGDAAETTAGSDMQA